MKITENFTYEELNPHKFEMSLGHKVNLEHLAFYTLQPLRDYYNEPLLITSGYRTIEYNNKIAGSNNSQHIRGQAVDFVVKDRKLLTKIFNDIDEIPKISYDQIIIYYNEGNPIPRWIHISQNTRINRAEKLLCKINKNGRKYYQITDY